MSRGTPQLRDVARRLMAYEPGGNRSSETESPAAMQVCDKLRPHLATLMGNGGFQALLARALALARPEAPWLREVHVKADGSLDGLEALHARLDPAEFLEGRIVVLAQLLGLLEAFIGEELTLRLVREALPKVPLDDLEFCKVSL